MNFSCIFSPFLKKFDLTPPQFNVLRILRGQFPKAISINEIINRMLDKSSNASRIVEKLKAKELIVKEKEVIITFANKLVEIQVEGCGCFKNGSMEEEAEELFKKIYEIE
jgi:hypothetical protein